MAIGNTTFCLALHLTGVHFRGELKHVGDVSEWKIKCGPIKTWEIGGVRLQDELYVIEHRLSGIHERVHERVMPEFSNYSACRETM